MTKIKLKQAISFKLNRIEGTLLATEFRDTQRDYSESELLVHWELLGEVARLLETYEHSLNTDGREVKYARTRTGELVRLKQEDFLTHSEFSKMCEEGVRK